MSQDQNTVPTSSTPSSTPNEPQAPHFEQALNELQHIVGQLNQSDLNLDAALELYERGVYLARHGRVLLQRAETRVDQLRESLGGDHETSS
jgi:exodeoxyribonuclease VII small subunit